MATVSNYTWYATYALNDGSTFYMSVVGNDFSAAYAEAVQLDKINGNPVNLIGLDYAGEVEYKVPVVATECMSDDNVFYREDN